MWTDNEKQILVERVKKANDNNENLTDALYEVAEKLNKSFTSVRTYYYLHIKDKLVDFLLRSKVTNKGPKFWTEEIKQELYDFVVNSTKNGKKVKDSLQEFADKYNKTFKSVENNWYKINKQENEFGKVKLQQVAKSNNETTQTTSNSSNVINLLNEAITLLTKQNNDEKYDVLLKDHLKLQEKYSSLQAKYDELSNLFNKINNLIERD
jgi:hypothetical protein